MNRQVNNLHRLKFGLFWSLGLNIIIFFGVWFWSGLGNAKSFFVGGCIAIIPQAVLGCCYFRFSGAQQSKKIWKGLVQGEILKFILTVLMFILAYQLVCINALYMLVAFIMMQVIGLFVNCKLLT